MNLSVAVANAPVSYGAFELTVGKEPAVPSGEDVLRHVSAAGYGGIDLGPPGYLAPPERLGARLAQSDLGLAGGYIELPYSEPDRLRNEMRHLRELLDVMDAAREAPGPKPKPTLADAGSEARRSRPGRAALDRTVGLDAEAWRRFAQGLEEAVNLCRGRGYEPTLHPETGTYVEAPWEIERALELTSIGLCLDTGHLVVGGGEPVRAVTDWGDRINHVHLKDARSAVVAGIVEESAGVVSIWHRRAFCPLGHGDVAIDEVLAGLERIGYSGWLVVEQDVLPDATNPEGPQRDQEANRAFLRSRGI